MSWEFYPGQRVVCVETWLLTPGLGYGDERGPVKGSVYTIRDVGFLDPTKQPSLQVRLAEIVNPARRYHGVGIFESVFRATRFRPLDERRLEVFRAHLNRVPAPEKEPA